MSPESPDWSMCVSATRHRSGRVALAACPPVVFDDPRRHRRTSLDQSGPVASATRSVQLQHSRGATADSAQRQRLDRFSRPSHARFVGDVPLDGRMPKCDLCRCEIAHLRVLQVYVIETVLRKCTKLDKCRDERIQLCDILESDIDTNATAESVELCVGANDRRKPAPVGSSGTFQERLQVEFLAFFHFFALSDAYASIAIHRCLSYDSSTLSATSWADAPASKPGTASRRSTIAETNSHTRS